MKGTSSPFCESGMKASPGLLQSILTSKCWSHIYNWASPMERCVLCTGTSETPEKSEHSVCSTAIADLGDFCSFCHSVSSPCFQIICLSVCIWLYIYDCVHVYVYIATDTYIRIYKCACVFLNKGHTLRLRLQYKHKWLISSPSLSNEFWKEDGWKRS